MKIPEYHDEADDDAPTGALTEDRNPAPDFSPSPLPEIDSSSSPVAGHVAEEAAERALADESVTAEEIADQSAYSGLETDVGQQAAHSEKAQAEARAGLSDK